MKPVIIPTRHDDPPWLLFFRLDEIAPFFCLLCVGILTRQLGICLLIGWVFSYTYKKLNAKYPKGFVLHWCYGKGLWLFSVTRTLKDPFNRRFITNVIKPVPEKSFFQSLMNSSKKKDQKKEK